jgi:glycosyltransferase involved in cell wall biosynthesis
MKVFLASFTYPPNKDGVSESAMSFAEGLAERGHEVVVGTGEPEVRGAVYDGPANPVVERFRIHGGPLHRDGISGEMARYRDFVVQGDFDALVCLCLDTWPTFLLLPLLPGLRGRKVLVSHGFSAHHWYPQRRFPWGLRSWLRGMMFTARTPGFISLFDEVVFNSARKDLGRFLDHRIASWSRHPGIRILPNSVAQVFFDGPRGGRSFREARGLADGPLFLCVANYSTRKNQQLAIRAFAEAAVPGASIVFIGSESNEHSRSLEKLAETLPPTPGMVVRVLSGVSRTDTIAAFHEAHAFVLSATEETQPFVLLEAMAAGLPFVSTPTGCVDEMPGGITASSAAEIAQAMRMLALDPALHAKLRAEGLAFARANCSRDRSVDLMEEMIGTRQDGERTVSPA